MNSTKTIILTIAAFVCFTSVFAISPINKSRFRGVAIKGYDPVSYFVFGEPKKGSSKFEFSYGGAKWKFANAENRDSFKKNPEKYAPQYGGYCAWAVSRGYTAKIDPRVWKIVDGKLYLNFNRSIQAQWEKSIKTNIRKADENWPKILKKEKKKFLNPIKNIFNKTQY